MNRFVALLRGINVSGHNIIKMPVLKQLLEYVGFKNVVTYIQSGNIVFDSDETNEGFIEELISKKINEEYGYQINVLVLSKQYLKQIFNDFPFTNIEKLETKKIGVAFLKEYPSNDNLEKVLTLKKEEEYLHFNNKALYLYCPNGIGKTKLSNNNIESKLKVSATSRNWNTITKLVELSNQ